LELDQGRAERARRRLASFSRVEIRKGDAYELVGRELMRAPTTPTALLIDGPKGFPALSLLLAAATVSGVKLVAQHNLDPDLAEFALLRARTRGAAAHYERLLEAMLPEAWIELEARERAHLMASGARRNLDHSSVALVRLDKAPRRTMLSTISLSLSLLQPAAVAAARRLGLHGALRRVARVSFGIQRRIRVGAAS